MAVNQINQLDFSKVYSYADYLTWQFKDRLELLRGRITLMSPAPSSNHQRISGNLFLAIGKYLESRPCALFSASCDVRLSQGKDLESDETIYTVVQPDLCDIGDLRKIDERGCLGAPDLVIEIASPGNSKREMDDKFSLYEEAGVEEYWIVLPAQNSVLIYTRNESNQFIGKKPVTLGENLETELFPGLEIDLSLVFKPLPS